MNLQALTLPGLAVGAYLLGAVPFSVLLGRFFLKKDIRAYGDHNPGAANVFRAGSFIAGMSAVLLDIAKGMPFVLLARSLEFSLVPVVCIGLCAILGHCFSLFLRFRGGKGVAVTYGVLIGLWIPAWLFPFCVAAIVGLLLWESNAWVMLLTPAVTLVFLLLTRDSALSLGFMLCIQALFTFKFASDVDGPPRLRAFWRERFLPRRQL
ncbi:MAG: glycerol-3-phosphate acyltransferase [Dehalococcoidia bacterium]|nr:glycerol-3-phosphate acyltransferase [Dehalococcoidia bacterium]